MSKRLALIAGLVLTQAFVVSAHAQGLTVTNASTVAGAVTGVPYSVTLTTSSGTAPFTWSVSGLPLGLSLNTATGVISGTPAVPGTATLSVFVLDNASLSGSATLTLPVTAGSLAAYTSQSTWQAASTGSNTTVIIPGSPGNFTTYGGSTFTTSSVIFSANNLQNVGGTYPNSSGVTSTGWLRAAQSNDFLRAVLPTGVNVSSAGGNYGAYPGNNPQTLTLTGTTLSGKALSLTVDPGSGTLFIGFVSTNVADPIAFINATAGAANNGPALIDFSYYAKTSTTTTLTRSPVSPSTFGRVLTLTATVSPSNAGKVLFLDGTTAIGTGTLSAGTATLTTSLLSAGVHRLRAFYLGSSTIAASYSGTITQTINPIPQNGFSAGNLFSTGTGTGPRGMAAGDFNKDGKTDIVTANFGANNGNTVSVLLGTGTGTLGTATTFTVAGAPIGAAVGDFNGDGNPDIAVACYFSDTVSILLGDGTGGFATAVNYVQATGSLPANIAVADFNGDGNADLAVSYNGSAKAGILLGTGTGTFGTAVQYAVGTHPSPIITGDFNNDGLPDLAMSSFEQGISVLLGRQDGSFGAVTNYATGGAGAYGIAAGDFNGDGNTDLVAPNNNSSNIGVLLGTGTGSFGSATTYATGASPSFAAIGDFNGDGIIDIAIPENTASASYSILFGTGTGTFGGRTGFAFPASSGSAWSLIAADFNGDGVSDLATISDANNLVSIVLGAAITTTSLTSSVNPSGFGGSTTLTATVSPSTAAGTVSFRDGGTQFATAPLSGGVATVVKSNFTVGTRTVTAVYLGNATNLTSTSSTVSQVVNQASSTTSVTSSANPSGFGGSVTFTATVGPSLTASGTVTFKDGATTIGTSTIVEGTATFTTSALTVATHSITAVYGGNANHTASTSSALSQVVSKGAVSLSLSTLPSIPVYGDNLTLNVTVTPSDATGTVTFLDGATTLGSGTLSGGLAGFSTAVLNAGNHSLSASYSGDSNYLSSTSAVSTISVGTALGTVSLTSSSNPSSAGSSVTFTATVSPPGATGNVSFFADGENYLGFSAVAGGTASISSSSLTAGSHTIQALYAGDANVSNGSSNVVTQTVNFLTTSTSLSSSASTITYGSPVTLTASVTPTSRTGPVAFYDGTTVLGSAPTSGGQAVFTTSLLSSGVRKLTARYATDLTHATSVSGVVTQTVNAAVSPGLSYATESAVTGDTLINLIRGDFNHDGKPDVAGTGPVTQGFGVAVLLGTGTGGFQTPVIYPTGTAPTVIVAGDFDSDGNDDLIVYNSGDFNSVILFGNANGTFQTAMVIGAGYSISSFATGDFDRDGNLDLAYASASGGEIAVALGFGDGSFDQFNHVDFQHSHAFLTAGDFNNDGLTDLLSVATGGYYVLVPGIGGGTFGSPATFNSAVQVPGGLIADDFNSDGNTDLATLDSSSSAVAVRLGIGDGTFGTAASYTAGAGTAPYTLTVGDFNGDGRPDLATANQGTSDVSILRANSNGTFQTAIRYSGLNSTPLALIATDLNRDGITDLAIAATSQKVHTYLGLPATTTTSLTSSFNPSTFGSNVTFTASVSPSAASGTVTFKDGASTIGTGTLSAGSATFTVASLTLGTHSITAVYGGDSSYVTSTSSALSQVVNRIATTTSLTSTGSPTTFGGGVTFTATLSSSVATGTMTFRDGATSLATLAVTAGAASFTITALSAGTHSITAQYSGDPFYLTSTSGALSHVVNQASTSTVLTSSLNPSTFGANITLSAAVTPSTATGTITIKDGAATLATGAVSGGSFTFTTPALTIGAHSLTAVYSGASDLITSTSPAVSQIVNQATTTTSLTSSLNPSAFGANVTFTAAVSPSAATGTVTFRDGATTLGTGTISSGTATFSISGLSVAGHSITAVYGGDASFITSTSSALNQVVNQTSTSTVLTSSANPSAFGSTITLTASVTPSSATGTVTFRNGATTLGTGTISAGSATFSTGVLPVATHSLTAVYAGDVSFLTSTSAAVNQTVNQAATSTSLTSSLNPSTFGAGVTFTATISPTAATGTVTFKDGATTLGTGNLSSGIATFNTAGLSVAGHSITAVYAGDGSFLPSTSSALNQVVNRAATSTVLTSSSNPSTFGSNITLTASVTPSSATGTVTFRNGATTLGTGTISAGSATFSTGVLPVATHALTAVYEGDPSFLTSTSTAVNQTVNQASTSTSLTSSLNPSTFGAAVVFTAAVIPATATGTITFKDGATTLGTAAISAGSATFSTNALTVAVHSITAVYGGDVSFLTSTSSVVSQTVNQAPTTTSLISSANPSVFAGSVTFTATLTPLTAIGSVTFNDGGVAIGSGAVSNGVATFTTTLLSAAAHAITAVYSGNASYITSTSASVTQTVNQAPTTTTLISSLNPSTFGASLTFTATLSASGASGTVTFSDGAVPIGTVPVNAGTASMTIASLGTGSHSVTAAYSGDSGFLSSTSPAVSQVVNQAATSTSLISSVNPTTFGAGTTLTASVSAANGFRNPTGTVTFRDGAITLGTVSLVPAGVQPNGIGRAIAGSGIQGSTPGSQATLAISTLAVGPHSLTAIYDGDVDYSTSISAALTQTVNQATTATVLTSSVNPSSFGAVVVLSAAVTPSAASGTVTFRDGATTIGTAALSGGTATFSTGVLSAGAHSLTAVYAGNVSFLTSTSSAVSQTVNQAPTTTSLISSANPSVFGGSVTFTATLTPLTATGTVTFNDGGVAIGSGTISNGLATVTTTLLSVAAHSITAVYSGDSSYLASTSIALNQTVNLAPTTITLTSSVNPSVFGSLVTFTATVSPSAATGNVTFSDGPLFLGSGSVVAGVATFSTTALSAGTHPVNAVYSGNSSYLISTSTAVEQIVSPSPTTSILTSSLNPSTVGQSVTLTASVTPNTGFQNPTGSFSFYDGATILGTATLSGPGVQPGSVGRGLSGAGILLAAGSASASLTVPAFTAGSHPLTVVYSGDSNNSASTSAAVNQVVNRVITSTLITYSANPAIFTQAVVLTGTVTPATATGTMQFNEGGVSLGTGVVINGVATLTLGNLQTGSHPITAAYSGDAANSTSTSPASALVINRADTSIRLSSSRNPSILNQPVILTAQMYPLGATGTITFRDGNTILGTVAVSTGATGASGASGATGSSGATGAAGTAGITTSSLTLGAHTLTATYNGDLNYLTSVSSGTGTALTFSAATPASILDSAGQGTGFSSRLPGTGASLPVNDPNLNLNTTSGQLAILSNPANLNAQTGLPPGEFIGLPLSLAGVTANQDFSVSAAFNNIPELRIGDQFGLFVGTAGTNSFRGGVISGEGTNTFTAHTVNGTATATATGSPAPLAGDNVVLTLSRVAGVWSYYLENLTDPSRSSAVPVNQPAFLDGVSGLVAGVFAGGAGAGTPRIHTVSAFSIAGPVQTVIQSLSTTVLTTSSATVTAQQPVTFTAVVTPSTATGAISFRDGGQVIGTATLANGRATFTTSSLTPGSHQITAAYGGDASNAASTSPVLTQQISQITTSTSLTSSPNPSVSPEPVTVTARVSPVTATGNIIFTDNGATLGTAPLSGGTATLTTAALTFGRHALGAIYSGDTSHGSSTAAAVDQTVNLRAPVLNTQTLPNGEVDRAYGPVQFTGTGGSGTYTFTASGLPQGLTMSSTGVLSGTARDGFTGSITVTLRDTVSGTTATGDYVLTITFPTLSLNGPTNLGNLAVGSPVTGSFTATGGKTPYTFTITGAAGLSISSSGAVTGNAGTAGAFDITVAVADSAGRTVSRAATLTVLGIVTGSIPPGTTITDYNATISAVGGLPPYTFTATGQPNGISFAGGTFSGRSTVQGTFAIAVQVRDSSGLTVSATYSLTVTGPSPLKIFTTSLADGTVSQTYTAKVEATGGTTPYKWTQTGGNLPAGLTLAETGDVTGQPTTPGTYPLGVQVVDANGTKAVGSVTIKILPAALRITSGSTLPSGVIFNDYAAQILSATGGVPPYTFGIRGTLPTGLTLNNGQIDGLPTVPGDYSFTVTATDAATPPNTGSQGVSVTMRPNTPDLVVNTGNLSFSLASGATTLPGSFAVSVNSSVVAQLLTYTTQVSVPWLSVTGPTSTPGALSVSLNSAALSLSATGSPYSTTVVVRCTSSVCVGKTQSFGVTLTVTAPPARLSVSTPLISFSTLSTNPATLPADVSVTNAGGGTLTLNSVTASERWLSVGFFQTAITAGSVVSIPVTANPAGLNPGYYTANVTVTSNAGTGSVPVTLRIAAAATMTLGPEGTQLSVPQGGTLGNPAGSFLVSLSGGGAVTYTATVQPGATWLTVAAGSGTASGSASGTVNYTVDTAAVSRLAEGTYYGTVQVAAGGIVNSPKDYQVVLNVTKAAARTVPNLVPAGLTFVSSGTGTVAPQTVRVFVSSAAAVPYQASATTDNGGNWLTITNASGSTSAAAAASIPVSVNTTGLTAGVYRGSVSVSFSSSAVRTVNVTLIIQATTSGTTGAISTSRAGAQAGPLCAGGTLVPTQTGLVSNFSAPTSWPTPLAIRLIDTCGTAVSSGQIVTTFSNGDPPLALSLVDPVGGVYSGTWTPRRASAQVTITASASSPGYASVRATIAGQVAPNAAPVIAPNGTQDIFNPQVGAGLGPGNVVQIYGSGLASQIAQPLTLPLPTTVSGTQVLIGGVPAPLFYVSPGQLNAQIPFELQANREYQVVVNANGALTTPQPIQLNGGTPAILNFSSGAVVAQHADGTLILETSPAKPGEFIVIYASGLGATDVTVPSGAASPRSPLARVKDVPVLTFGGGEVKLLYAGLTPDFVGLYQINFQVPENTPDGNISLVLNQSGTASNTTSLTVRK